MIAMAHVLHRRWSVSSRAGKRLDSEKLTNPPGAGFHTLSEWLGPGAAFYSKTL
jgi:hypothetical protein